MSEKKLVFLINSLDGGGAERVMTTLLNRLVAKYTCYLIMLDDLISYKLDSKVNIIILNNSKKQSDFKKFLMLPVLAYRLSKIINQNNFLHVISFMYRSNYINVLSSYFTKHTIIISERAMATAMYAGNSLSSKINRFMITSLYNRSDKVLSVSDGVKYSLKNDFLVSAEQFVIYNPYNLDKIQLLSEVPINLKLNKDKTIITVGSLIYSKNHQMLIRAFAKLDKEYTLLILGQGELADDLKNLTVELNIDQRVFFLGFDNNPYKYLSKSSVFVLPSNSEGFPNVLVEAMVCKCSVISTDCLAGPREILAPNTKITKQIEHSIEFAEYGILIPMNDIETLYKTFCVLENDRKLKNKYAKKAFNRACEFDIDLYIKKFEEIVCAE